MKRLKFAYFGTPYFSARFLENLMTDTSINRLIEVKLVVTQADKPVGKKQILTKTPVKIIAEKFGIEVYDENSKLKAQNSKLKLKIQNVDFALVFAYGFRQLIPKEILETPKIKFGDTSSGFINIHPSLLPRYRGASPIAYPLVLGDKKTGATLFVMDEKMDHGSIIAQEEFQIKQSDRRPDLEIKLTDLAFNMFKKILTSAKLDLVSTDFNRFQLIQQNHSQASYAPYLKKADGFIPFETLKKAINNQQLTIEETPKIIFDYINKYNLIENWKLKIKNSSKIIYDFFRGMYPWPGLWSLVNIKGQPHFAKASRGKQKRLKITDLDLVDNKLTIRKVQLEGKKEVDFKTFNSAHSVF